MPRFASSNHGGATPLLKGAAGVSAVFALFMVLQFVEVDLSRMRQQALSSQLGHLTTSLSTWAGNDTGSGAAQQQAGPQQAGQQSEQQQQQQADETKQQQQDGSAGSAGAGAGVDEDPFHGKRLDVSGLPSVFNLLTDYPQENSWLAKAAKDKKADL